MKGRFDMTDFAMQQLAGPVISSLVSKDKGDLSNRLSCAGEQLKNNVKTLAADTVVVGGTAAGIAATKNKGIAKFLAKPLEFVGNQLSKLTKTKVPTVLSKIGNKIKNMPTRYKAIALVVAAGLGALSYIGQKHLYQAGQIDQKYTDKAKLNAKTNEAL